MNVEVFQVVYDVGPREAEALLALPTAVWKRIMEARRLDNQQMIADYSREHPGDWIVARVPVAFSPPASERVMQPRVPSDNACLRTLTGRNSQRGHTSATTAGSGRIQKGQRLSPATEFKPGQHWRPRQPHWDREWLEHEYRTQSAGDLARSIGCTEGNVLHWLRKHGIPRRSVSEARALKHWGSNGKANPMFGRTGAANPNYTDGSSPERQRGYVQSIGRAFLRAVYERCCAACGAPWVRVVERGKAVPLTPSDAGRKATWTIGDGERDPASRTDTPLPRHYRPVLSEDWAPGCKCDAPTQPCTVLDPFAGAGTALLVADRLQRNAIGIELNTAYTTMAMDRVRADAPLLAADRLFSSWPPAEDPADQRMAYEARQRDLFGSGE